MGGGDEEIGLAAEEGGDLEHEVHVAEGVREAGAVFGGVDVGEDWETCVLCDAAQDARAFDEAGATEAADAGAVGFVVAGFEDVGDVEIGGDALDGLSEGAGVGFAFEDAGAGDEEEAAFADLDVRDLKGIGGGSHTEYLTTGGPHLPGRASHCTSRGGRPAASRRAWRCL